jgi:glucosamine-phosphate N-acetyltransferase
MEPPLPGRIRPAEPGDLKAFLRLLYQLSPGEGISERQKEAWRELLEDRNQSVWVYEEDGEIIGTATFMLRKNVSHGGRPVGYIENVVVDAVDRRKRIGLSLINHCLEQARSLGCYKVVLTCAHRLIPFYLCAGFRVHEEVVMRKDL